jgi:hypothetical protein
MGATPHHAKEGPPVFTIDIDTGGTMTDGLVSGSGADGPPQVVSLKVETTPSWTSSKRLGPSSVSPT